MKRDTVILKLNEKKVLRYLNKTREEFDTFAYCSFKPISSATRLPVKEVRRICRALSRKGFTHFARGLFTYDGDLAGAGYSITDEGADLINSKERD